MSKWQLTRINVILTSKTFQTRGSENTRIDANFDIIDSRSNRCISHWALDSFFHISKPINKFNTRREKTFILSLWAL